MTRGEFIHVHSSGRFDQAPVLLEESLDEFMTFADLITMTEVSDRDRFLKLKETGWDASLPSGVVRDDCGIAWRKTTFPRLLFETTQILSGRVYKNDRGLTTRPQHGNFAAIEHRNGHDRTLVAVTHMPHGMAQDLIDRDYRGDVAKCYISDFKEFKKVAKHLARKFKCNGILLVSDFNIDIKRPWVTGWFDQYAPIFDVNWRKPYPKQGTLGRRLIDLTLYEGLICTRKPVLLERNEGEDHTPYKQSFRFRRD